jgi:LmbE family N-acetylglucosaminyl deacetylase/glycosyltransferase involved in cell wall biosynthesis
MTLPEAEAIPYQVQELRGERLLILAPHPDDEVIGCGGLLALHLRDGRAVRAVIATDGGEAGNAEEREKESIRALATLGQVPVDFLRFGDRHLADHAEALQERLRAILIDFKPDLIAVPSPVEIHPDHIALSRAFCELIQSDGSLFAALAVTRVVFYEVSAPIRPNVLVDISAVAETKYEAIRAHESQIEIRDYVSYARGLNAYRAMTLPPEIRFAEAYWLTPLPSLRTTPFSALREAVGSPPRIEVEVEPLPVSVVVRTKDRPALLREATDSIRATGYPAEIIIVNDGGARPELAGVKIINHEKSRGRSEAMNSGVRAAKTAFIAFLDDDDLYYPEHLATLAASARSAPQHVAWYTDAISAFARLGASGTLETHARMRIFAQDFDRQLLLVDNYIPLPTLLMKRELFLELGGFDPAFDLFEDWDFLIRLAQRGTFAHVPRVTCEIRHIEGAGSITLQSPEGSARFRAAKLQVWKKHEALVDENVIADVLERQKRRVIAMGNDVVEAKGLQSQFQTDIARLEREKAMLLGEIQSLHQRINEISMRISHLEGANAEVRNALAAAEADRHEKNVRLQDARAALAESERSNAALFAETARLQGLLDLIYQSKTWKLHSIVERMKGRA